MKLSAFLFYFSVFAIVCCLGEEKFDEVSDEDVKNVKNSDEPVKNLLSDRDIKRKLARRYSIGLLPGTGLIYVVNALDRPAFVQFTNAKETKWSVMVAAGDYAYYVVCAECEEMPLYLNIQYPGSKSPIEVLAYDANSKPHHQTYAIKAEGIYTVKELFTMLMPKYD